MTDLELLARRSAAVDRLAADATKERAAQRNTVASQFWRFDIAVRQADRNARITGRRYAVRRAGTTNSGKPVWDIRPVTRQP